MEAKTMEPKTLLEAVEFFKSPENCRVYMVPRRWSDGIVKCPRCGTDRVKFSPKHNRWQCSKHHALRQFTLKTGTIMEDSPIGLDKWLPAIWLVSSNRNGISSWELHRALGVTQKTAWFMLHRIRLAMQTESSEKLDGEIEADETYIGGRARNMHKSRWQAKIDKEPHTRRGIVGKVTVLGILKRDGEFRAKVAEQPTKEALTENIKKNVHFGSDLFTDDLTAYFGLGEQYVHEIVNHAENYVIGRAHTNGCENFWSLLKRGLHGTYISVEPFHLFRYLDEQIFRFNNRLPMSDADRFSLLVQKVVGKRLTYAQLTGREEERPEAF
jgi:transposase-like protein